MRIWRSLSFRLALIYMGLFLASMLILSGIFYWVTVRGPLESAEAQVAGEAAVHEDIARRRGLAALASELDSRADRDGARKAFHALIDPAGRVLTANISSWPRTPAADWLIIESDINVEGQEIDHEALLLDQPLPGGARLLIGRDIYDIVAREKQLSAATTWIVGVSILLGLGGGLLMSLAIGRRIDSVTRAARRVIAGDLTGRVPLRGTHDDFDRLGETLNAMLTRIEELVDSIRRVSDNAAHELRTPLARLRTHLETLADTSDVETARRIDMAIAEAGRLESVFDAVLRITRLENRRQDGDVRPVDLAPIIGDAVEFYRPEAEDRALTLRSEIGSDLFAVGNRDLLFQAFCNILDNAVKYTRPGDSIVVRGRSEAGEAIFEVADSGPGVPADELPHLAERFYRGRQVGEKDGIGLGLSFVTAVMAISGYPPYYRNLDPGLLVGLRFRRAA
ncbi:MAG: sensor histidine kinase [Sphingobium sp.]